MITIVLIVGSTLAGMFLGFWLCDLKVFMDGRAGASPAPTRPEVLTATPEEIVAVYEAKLEMEDRMAAYPMSKKGLKGWEKEQTKREKRRVR